MEQWQRTVLLLNGGKRVSDYIYIGQVDPVIKVPDKL